MPAIAMRKNGVSVGNSPPGHKNAFMHACADNILCAITLLMLPLNVIILPCKNICTRYIIVCD